MKNPIEDLIDFINSEITERRDCSASKMCEIIRDKIKLEIVYKEYNLAIKFAEWCNSKTNDDWKYGRLSNLTMKEVYDIFIKETFKN